MSGPVSPGAFPLKVKFSTTGTWACAATQKQAKIAVKIKNLGQFVGFRRITFAIA
jgi:hypothetical protein